MGGDGNGWVEMVVVESIDRRNFWTANYWCKEMKASTRNGRRKKREESKPGRLEESKTKEIKHLGTNIRRGEDVT